MKPLEAIRCTSQSCTCECFSPGKLCLRYCESCSHGWVAHALDKLGYQQAYSLGMQVEVVQPNIVFDIASLMLYGAQATPVRLKILLDRLLSVLQHEEVLQVLHGFGWTYEDYARGYILQDTGGRVLDKWSMATRDEEHVILQQFLRFGETKTIAQEIILQDTRDKQESYSKQTSRAESEIKKFIERSNLSVQSFMKLGDPARHMFAAHAAAGRLPFVAAGPATRILASPILAPTATPYSPSRDQTARPLSLTSSSGGAGIITAGSVSSSGGGATSTPLTSPLTTPLTAPLASPLMATPGLATTPLSRLQAYEFRRELATSPAISTVDKVSLAVTPSMAVPTVVMTTGGAAVMAGGPHSPASPHNLSTTPSSLQSSPCVTPHKGAALSLHDTSQDMHNSSFNDDDDDSDSESEGAIDYSTKDSTAAAAATATSALALSLTSTNSTTTTTTGTTTATDHSKSAAAAAAAAARHMRKSSNPIKRQWIPSASFGNSFIGPNGKKRVLCTACNKTFCDKGALKIHYSAVHLKEMHKCTVEGCNMMFSSRRSRNRHSANPNPKLHMPQKRKELEGMEDDEGMASMVNNVVSSLTTSLSAPLSTTPSSSSSSAAAAPVPGFTGEGGAALVAGGLLRADPAYFMELGAQFPFAAASTSTSPSHQQPPEKRIKLEAGSGSPSGQGQPQEMATDLTRDPSGSETGRTDDEDRMDTDTASIVRPAFHPANTNNSNDNDNDDNDADNKSADSADAEDAETETMTAEGEDLTKDDINGQRGGNRRKSNAPLRCSKNDDVSKMACEAQQQQHQQQQLLLQQQQQQQQFLLQAQLPIPLTVPMLVAAGLAGGERLVHNTIGVGVQAGTAARALDATGRSQAEDGVQAGPHVGQQTGSQTGPQTGPQTGHQAGLQAGLQAGHQASQAGPVDASLENNQQGGVSSFPQIASLLLSAKEQRDKDDSSDNELVINGDVGDDDDDDDDGDDGDDDDDDNEGSEERGGVEEKEAGNDATVTSTPPSGDNDHNHNTVAREEGVGEEGEEEGECGSLPSSDSAENLVALDPGSEVYLAKDNPRKCALCGKLFQNQFTVKVHFQNVHLKLMHGCTVDGCSAAFPSKRSRDRHSSNLNLHRKMLSGGDSGLDSGSDPTLREDILSTLYGANQLMAASSLSLQCNGQQEVSSAGDDAGDCAGPVSLVAKSTSSANGSNPLDNAAIGEEENVSTKEEEVNDATTEALTQSATSAEEGAGRAEEREEEGAEEEEEGEGVEEPAVTSPTPVVTAPPAVRGQDAVCMSRKPVCCGMTFHTESALKEHYALSHPSQTLNLSGQSLPLQPLKPPPRHAPATETLLASRRPRHRPNKHKNGLQRLVSTGRKNGFS